VNFTLEHDTDQAATDIENMLARWLSSHISQIDVALRDCPPNPGIIAGNSAK
jgi:hemerythrin